MMIKGKYASKTSVEKSDISEEVKTEIIPSVVDEKVDGTACIDTAKSAGQNETFPLVYCTEIIELSAKINGMWDVYELSEKTGNYAAKIEALHDAGDIAYRQLIADWLAFEIDRLNTYLSRLTVVVESLTNETKSKLKDMVRRLVVEGLRLTLSNGTTKTTKISRERAAQISFRQLVGHLPFESVEHAEQLISKIKEQNGNGGRCEQFWRLTATYKGNTEKAAREVITAISDLKEWEEFGRNGINKVINSKQVAGISNYSDGNLCEVG